ncbi:MAG TPA: hypothetical protein VEA69_22120 [Tepidisphaeraceae bacterium]|nr:hypothetical protein [Tepidisphaeraceae bacterium]
MQFRSISGFVVAVAVCMSANSAPAADAENPAYKNWAKFKVGSWSKVAGESAAAGTTTKTEMTYKLVELTPDKAVVELVTSMDAGGTKMDLPAQKMEIPAKGPAAGATGAPDAPKPDMKESTEEVEVAGKKVKCKVTEVKTDANGMKMTSKSWTSEDVPGGLVKMESNGEGAMKMSSKMTLSGFEAK